MDFFNGAVTLVAAFAGAWAAFLLQRRHERSKSRAEEVERCNRMLLVLMQQANFVRLYRRQVLGDLVQSPARHFLIRPTGQLDYSHLVAEAASLAFLLKTDATEVPQMVALANERFHRLIAAINDRALYHHEFQAALEASGLDVEAGVPHAEVEKAIGMRLSLNLKTATNGVIELADDAEASLTGIGRDVPPVLRRVYRGHKIISYSTDASRASEESAV